MKIFYLAPGDSVHSHRWVDYFAQRNHEVHWASLEKFTLQCSDNIYKYTLAPVKLEIHQILQGALSLRALLNKIRPDVLHVHSAGRNGVVSLLSGYHPRVITAWGSEVLIAGKSRFIGPLVKRTLGNADIITCDADHMRQAMLDMGVDRNKINIVYFGTDTERFVPKPKNSTLRNGLGAQDKPVIISLRSLEPLYNVETLLYAAQQVIKKDPNVRFIIVGDGSEKEYLVKLAKSLDIQEHILFTGKIQNQLLPDYLTSSDIYVSTSLSDAGLAASTAEAMSCGLPVVVTNSGENRLWVEENKGGFVVDVKDPDAMADRLLLLLNNPSKRNQFGAFNRALIEKRNNYRIEMLKMEKIYENMVKFC